MPQFAVHENPNPATRKRFPLLLDVQTDLLDSLATRVVIPMEPADARLPPALQILTPVCGVAGRQYVLYTSLLGTIAAADLGPPVASLADGEHAIIGALDFLIRGF